MKNIKIKKMSILFLSLTLATSFLTTIIFAVDANADPKHQRVSLHDLGVLQLVAHDLFNVDRKAEVDNEDGKLNLSTLLDHGDENIALGGEFRNRENIILFTVASEFGAIYLDHLEDMNKKKAREKTVEEFHEYYEGWHEGRAHSRTDADV